MSTRRSMTGLLVVALFAAACSAEGAATPQATDGATTTDEATATLTAAETTAPGAELTSPLLGLTAFPSQPTADGVSRAFELAASDGVLAAHHFDRGIPWPSLISDEPVPEAFLAELRARRAASADQSRYVATAITNFERDDIPGGLDGSARPPELEGAGPADARVVAGLITWVDLLVEQLDPDYLNVGVEIDLAIAKQPLVRDDLITLYRTLYDHAKAEYPDIVVFASFQAELGAAGVIDDLVGSTDLIAVSTYPYFDGVLADDDFVNLDRFFNHGVDVAIAETGYPAGRAATPGGIVESSPEQQAAYMTWLLEQACSREMAFVVWFLPTDVDIASWNYPPELEATARVFATNGMYDLAGNPRASAAVWKDVLNSGCRNLRG